EGNLTNHARDVRKLFRIAARRRNREQLRSRSNAGIEINRPAVSGPFGRAGLILEALSNFSSCSAIERYYSEPLLSDLAALRIATEISDLFSIRRPARRTIRAVVVDELAQPALLVEFPLDRCNLASDFHHSKVV